MEEVWGWGCWPSQHSLGAGFSRTPSSPRGGASLPGETAGSILSVWSSSPILEESWGGFPPKPGGWTWARGGQGWREAIDMAEGRGREGLCSWQRNRKEPGSASTGRYFLWALDRGSWGPLCSLALFPVSFSFCNVKLFPLARKRVGLHRFRSGPGQGTWWLQLHGFRLPSSGQWHPVVHSSTSLLKCHLVSEPLSDH